MTSIVLTSCTIKFVKFKTELHIVNNINSFNIYSVSRIKNNYYSITISINLTSFRSYFNWKILYLSVSTCPSFRSYFIRTILYLSVGLLILPLFRFYFYGKIPEYFYLYVIISVITISIYKNNNLNNTNSKWTMVRIL